MDLRLSPKATRRASRKRETNEENNVCHRIKGKHHWKAAKRIQQKALLRAEPKSSECVEETCGLLEIKGRPDYWSILRALGYYLIKRRLIDQAKRRKNTKAERNAEDAGVQEERDFGLSRQDAWTKDPKYTWEAARRWKEAAECQDKEVRIRAVRTGTMKNFENKQWVQRHQRETKGRILKELKDRPVLVEDASAQPNWGLKAQA